MQIEKLFTFEVELGYYQSYDLHVLKSFFGIDALDSQQQKGLKLLNRRVLSPE